MSQPEDQLVKHDVDQELGDSLSELERQSLVYRRRGFKNEADRLDGAIKQMRSNRKSPGEMQYEDEHKSA
jgi:hypothetical protein